MNHKHAWDLIPWYVNGTASETGRMGLQRHIEQCAACREEVEVQRQLLQAMKIRPLVENMPHGSFQKLLARIEAEPAPSRPAAPGRRHSRLVGWLAAAVVVQTVLLGTLSVALLRAPPRGDAAADFRTVSSPAPAPGKARVRAVFSPDMTLGELQALLERSRLQVVSGPSADGVYTLAPVAASEDPRQALLALRAHPAVKFAESVGP